MFTERTHFTELNQMAEEAKRRAEIARYAVIFFDHSRLVLADDVILLTFRGTFLGLRIYNNFFFLELA